MWLVISHSSVPDEFATMVALEDGKAVVVGRGGDCDVILRERRVSRRHVRLRRNGPTVDFEDLGSTAGLFLNGSRLPRGRLAPGDRLAVGGAVLRVTDRDPGLEELPAARSPARPAAPAEPTPGWQPFRAFIDRLRSAADPRGLLECLLTGLAELFHAERGFVLLRGHGRDELVPVASYTGGDPGELLALSRTVYEHALSVGKTVFIDDTSCDPWYLSHSDRSLENQPRSIVCAPLRSSGRNYGVIYLDAPGASRALHVGNLTLFESATSLASELLASRQTRKSLLAAQGRIEALNTLAWENERLVLGDGPSSRRLRELVEAAASKDVTVLVTGETGTGKEMVARALHRLSSRRDEPFVPIHCAALPRDILEAELFGAEKGAYTGCDERRIGRFELADGGTLFLDEVGELPLDFQVKLLRVLQERTISRLGGNEPIALDFRLVCATNRNLEEAVAAGTFREDFYYRVNVMRIDVAPLRERPEDILPLARHFLALHGARFAGGAKPLTPEAEALVTGYPWPGNVRELENAIERALVIEKEDAIRPASLPIAAAPPQAAGQGEAFWDSLPDNYEGALEAFERGFLRRSLDRHEGNVAAVARQYGMTRAAIYRRLTRLGLIDERGRK